MSMAMLLLPSSGTLELFTVDPLPIVWIKMSQYLAFFSLHSTGKEDMFVMSSLHVMYYRETVRANPLMRQVWFFSWTLGTLIWTMRIVRLPKCSRHKGCLLWADEKV